VWLADEEPNLQQFVVSVEEELLRARTELAEDPVLLRSYAERVVQVRLHQPVFRQRVLLAYQNKCALCHLKHTRLLDAAHVIPDAEGGEPVVTNGISMCKIHHAAYDANIFGINPDYRIGVRPDVMEEIDGPTLRYTLQGIDGSKMDLPKSRAAKPNPDALHVRWKQFLDAS
jgi:putative restriction endonuclease